MMKNQCSFKESVYSLFCHISKWPRQC